MSIFDAIMALSGRKDPAEEMKRRIIAEGAAKDAATPATPDVPAVPPRIGSPQEPDPGADPNTPPPAVDPVPKAYQPVPDLSAMYQELMDRQDKLQRRNSFDQGATLIAAGLARDENRDRIMKSYPNSDTNGSGSDGLGGLSSLSNSILAAQKAQQELLIKNQLRLAVPKIAKELGIPLEDAYLMFENGKLEDYISARRMPQPTVVEKYDGSKDVVDINASTRGGGASAAPAPEPVMPSIPAGDGTPVPLLRDDIPAPEAAPAVEPSIPGVNIAPPRPPEPSLVGDGKGGQRVVFKTPKGLVDEKGNPVTEIANTTITHQPDGNGGFLAFDAAGERVPAKDITSDQVEYLPRPDGKGGTVAVRKDDHTIVGTDKVYAGAEAPPRKISYLPRKDGKGGTVGVYDDDGTIVGTTEKYEGSEAPPVKITMQPDPNGTGLLAVDEYGNRVPGSDIKGGADLIIDKTADGRFQAINKNTGEAFGKPFGDAKKEEPSKDMQEWAFARAQAALRGETFPDWPEWLKTLTAKRDPKPPSANMDPKTGILWPDPPTDMTYAHDANGDFIMDPATNTPKVVDIAGSKKAVTAADEATKAASQVESRQQSAGIVAGMVDNSLKVMDNDAWWDPSTGAFAPIAGIVEGSSRAQLEETLSPIKAIVAFEYLAEMRKNSPTGGALGNVSDIELRLLASTLGSLEPRQGRESLRERLRLIKEIVGDNSKKALLEWRKKYNPNGIGVDESTETPDPAATDAPPPGAKVRKWVPKGVPTSP